VVEDFWWNHVAEGWMGFILKDKLKELKIILRAWNKEIYGAIDTKIMFLVEEIKRRICVARWVCFRRVMWSCVKNTLWTFGIFLKANNR
jgi:hypothetical protein